MHDNPISDKMLDNLIYGLTLRLIHGLEGDKKVQAIKTLCRSISLATKREIDWESTLGQAIRDMSND